MDTTGQMDSARVRQAGTGLAMLAGPLALAAGFALHPAEKDDGAAQLQVIADNSGRWAVTHLLLIVGALLLIPAALELARWLRGRSAWVGLAASVLVPTGVAFVGVLVGAEAIAPSALADLPAGERAAVAPGMQAIIDFKGAMSVALGFAALPLGLLALAGGLFATRAVARWSSAALALGAILLATDVLPVMAVGALALLAGLLPTAAHLLRPTSPAARLTAPAPARAEG